ncbi:DUF1294 domain-containing protein [Citrobacter sp. S2-9]|uniref:DUF1294 domain-containing protein n=1 Tax=Citrobacter enshiensis TaxID=2971264 RepID=A0ABT8PWA6_9ENTR|nr:DUF1294 domain-containing protein [Citrobacter enshiensis]MDN8600655.1 DUF1294 domain-containing protein [Citrobacter enshiensis]
MRINQLCYSLLALALIASFYVSHSFWVWLLLVNLFTFLLYGADKYAARSNWQRVPEKTLLIFGLVGGWPGGAIAQQLFRHKTQKQPFKTWFILSVVANVVVLLGLVYQSELLEQISVL